MRDFKHNDRSSSRRPAGGFAKKPFGRPQGEMHAATCANCHKPCQVPFRPDGSRPIYCRDCFGAHSAPETARPFVRREGREPVPMPALAVVSQTPDPRIDSIVSHLAKLEAKMDHILLAMAVAKAEKKTRNSKS